MKKHLYEIKRLDIPAYLKWWFIKYRNAGTLSEIMENLTSPITLTNSLRRKFKIFEIGGKSEQKQYNGQQLYNVNDLSSVSEGITIDDEGWITAAYDNSSGSSGKYLNFLSNLLNLKTSTQYALIIEIKSVSVSSASLTLSGKNNITQIDTDVYIPSSQLAIGIYKYIIETKNSFENTTRGLRSFFNVSAGGSVSAMFRISIIEDTTVTTDTFDYEPYTGGQPAPNPSYECPIQNVTGNVEVKVSNGTDSTAEGYEEQTVTFPLAEGQVLHEGDTIEDKIVQRRKTIVLDGTENWAVSGNRFRLILNDAPIPIRGGVNILCNYYKRTYNYNENGIFLSDSWFNSATKFLVIVDSSFSTLEDFKTWLAEKYANGTPLTIEYELAEPLETEFTEAQRTAKAQIDSLHSYKGTTHISSSNNPSPLFTIQYIKEET